MSDISTIFTSGDKASDILLAWWHWLEKNRGDRAHLRRVSMPAEIAYCQSFHQLLGQLRAQGLALGSNYLPAIAAIAGLSAHVKSLNTSASLAEQMGTPKQLGGRARVSGLRFRRLLAIQDRDELYSSLIRVIRLLRGDVNIISLANSIFWWNENTKKKWAYEYYSKAPSEP